MRLPARTFTQAEVEEILQAMWDDTGRWDPKIKGTVDREIEGLDPEIPEQLQKRKEVLDRHDYVHTAAVESRRTLQWIKGWFRNEQEIYRQSLIDQEPWTGPRACCVEYLAELDRLDRDWIAERAKWASGDLPYKTNLSAEQHVAVLNDCLASNAEVREFVTSGTYTVGFMGHPADGTRQVKRCCPWDNRWDQGPFHETYKALTKMSDEEIASLEFGPIEVIPDTWR